jgi:putative chitinase
MTVQALQAKIGVDVDGDFGKNTLKSARDYFKMTNAQAANFFGQCHHESGGFKVYKENLNYSADGLLKIFPKYFPTMSVALAYARDAEAIANKVYANRMGNGDVISGDGWNFRGRGAIQLTGKATYQAFANSDPKFSGVMANPDLVATEFAFESALWFFGANDIMRLCVDTSDKTIEKVTRKINGGTNGLVDREIQTRKLWSWLS